MESTDNTTPHSGVTRSSLILVAAGLALQPVIALNGIFPSRPW